MVLTVPQISTFAKVTNRIDLLAITVKPVARLLYNWLLRKARPGRPIEFELLEFSFWTGQTRKRPYCLVQIKRGLNDLINLGLVEVVKKFNSACFKVITHRPEEETLKSDSETKKSDYYTKKFKKQDSSPYSVVPSYREVKDTNTPTSHPVVIKKLNEEREENDQELKEALAELDELLELDSDLPIENNSTVEVKSSEELLNNYQEELLETDTEINNEPTPQELGRVLEEVRQLSPNFIINIAVRNALSLYWQNVPGAIAYVREAVRTWTVKPGFNWNGLLVKAVKEGRKPENYGKSAIPEEINPPTKDQLDQLEAAKAARQIHDYYLSSVTNCVRVVFLGGGQQNWWEFLKT